MLSLFSGKSNFFSLLFVIGYYYHSVSVTFHLSKSDHIKRLLKLLTLLIIQITLSTDFKRLHQKSIQTFLRSTLQLVFGDFFRPLIKINYSYLVVSRCYVVIKVYSLFTLRDVCP
jgi:hypothetical protein